MATLLFTFAVFLLAGAGLAVGVMFGRAPIKGSCGGLACLGEGDCAACPKRKERLG